MAEKILINCHVNGNEMQFKVFPMQRALDVLREMGNLMGIKEGCGEGECGACSIFIDNKLVNSCLIPAIQLDGTEIVTIEGVEKRRLAQKIQNAFLKYGGAQCGICTPGMILATIHLIEKNPKPTEEEIRQGLAGNICRCTGYTKIFDSVVRACREMETV